MGRSKKENEPPNNQVELPTSVEDVVRLPLRELNILLCHLGLTRKGKRSHKVTTVCQTLRLESGKDAFLDVLTVIRDMKEGWTKNLTKCPPVTLNQITEYLLQANKCTIKIPDGDYEAYTGDTLLRYKVLRSYNLYSSGHVHSMEFAPLSDVTSPYCAMKSKVNPSWDTSGTVYSVVVVIQQPTGQPIGASCTCVAGKGESCCHVAATCFALEDMTSNGIQTLPENPATTELLCAWTAPKGTKVISEPLSEVQFQKKRPHEEPGKGFVKNHDPTPHKTKRVDYEKAKKLIHGLNLCAPRLPILTCVDPEAWRPCQPELIEAAAPTLLRDTYSMVLNDYDIVPCSEKEVFTTARMPPTVSARAKAFASTNIDLPPLLLVDSFVSSLQWTQEEVQMVALTTRLQSQSEEWYAFRKGLVTGSTFHTAAVQGSKLSGDIRADVTAGTVSTILHGNTWTGNESTKYGLENEKTAVDAYKQKVGVKHRDMKLLEFGLILSPKTGYLGASIDRYRVCGCCAPRIIEIKCPPTLETKPFSEFHEASFLQGNNQKVKLRETHKYYSQIQGYMAVTGTKVADFVVWSPAHFVVLEIPYNAVFWEKMKKNIDLFYRNCIAPPLLNIAREHFLADVINSSDIVRQNVCFECKLKLPEEGEGCVDNSDASVRCECECECDRWFHWSCADYCEDENGGSTTWFCKDCTQSCM